MWSASCWYLYIKYIKYEYRVNLEFCVLHRDYVMEYAIKRNQYNYEKFILRSGATLLTLFACASIVLFADFICTGIAHKC